MSTRLPKIILLMFSFTLIGGLFSANALAAPGDINWRAMGWNSPGEYIYAIAEDSEGNVYIGGSFTNANGIGANGIAKWNGHTWSALGSGLTFGFVNAIAIDSVGTVYAAGSFPTAGGLPANRIAKWNGSSWSTLGSGITDSFGNANVRTLLVDSYDNLYVGGYFSTAGGVSVKSIAKWNGSTWSALGTGVNNTIFALAMDSSENLYIGGAFDVAGGITSNGIAKWNGSAWSNLGSGINLFGNNRVNALVVDNNDNLYIGGEFTTISGVSANTVAKWNGVAWSALGTGMTANPGTPKVYALSVGANHTLYASGYFHGAGGVAANYIAHWDGSAWLALGSGTNNEVTSLLVNQKNDLYVGGNFAAAGGQSITSIAQWRVPTKKDFDGDKSSDILQRNPATGAWQSFLMNNAAVSTSAALSIDTTSDTVYQAQLDATGDGTADVLTRRTSDGAWILSTVENNVATNTTTLAMLTYPAWQYIGSGDFNGDRTDDILIRNSSTHYWYVYYLQNGVVSSGTSAVSIWNAASNIYQGAADLNGDGKAEVLMRNTAGLWSVYNFVDSITYAVPGLWLNNSWQFQALMDFNKDGIKDILLRDTNAGDLNPGVWVAFTLNSSYAVTSVYGLNNVYRNLSLISLANTGDYDGNGTDDLLLRNSSNGAYYMFTTNTPAEANPGLQILRAAPVLYAAPWSVMK